MGANSPDVGPESMEMGPESLTVADVIVEQVWDIDLDLAMHTRLNELLPQLSATASPQTFLFWKQMLNDFNGTRTHLYVARLHSTGYIIGYALRVDVMQAIGRRSWIEDVVVDKAFRIRGVSDELIQRMLDEVPPGTRYVDLTCKPDREGAHKLYGRLGFVQRTTDVFRWMPPA